MIKRLFQLLAWVSLFIWVGFLAQFLVSEASQEVYNRLLFAIYSLLELHFLLLVYDKAGR